MKNHIKKAVKNKKFWIMFGLTKVPFMIYLVMAIAVVPSIQATEANYILGAHRGASVDFKENTLEAFEKAVNDEKYAFIEFDIQYTKDGKIVVFHQNNIIRMPKKGVETSEMTYEELNEVFEFHIPEYKEVMDLIECKKPVNIEIKSHGNYEEDVKLVDYIVEDCRQRGNCNQLLISSISEEVVDYVEENYPEVPTGKIYWAVPATFIGSKYLTKKFVNQSDADYLMLHGYNVRNYELLNELKPADKKIVFWYFTDEVYIMQDNAEQEKVCGFWNADECAVVTADC